MKKLLWNKNKFSLLVHAFLFSTVLTSMPAYTQTTLNPNLPPGTNFDLSHWKLTLPDAKATEISASQLSIGYSSPYFYTDKNDGAMVFWSPASGGTTANTHYPRSELREMLDPNDKRNNWTWQGTHTLKVRGTVLQTPPNGKTIVMQIHAIFPNGKDAPPLVKLEFNRNRLDALVKASPKGGKDTHHVFNDIELGQPYEAQLKMVNGVLSITVNGNTQSVDVVSANPGWKDLKFYFKAGNYVQDLVPNNPQAGGKVKIYRLAASHF